MTIVSLMSDNQQVSLPPHSKESEMMVLGCMLTNYNSLNSACELLQPFDFYFHEHKTIFEALQSAYKQDKPADIHLVSEELKRMKKLEAVGGVGYLTTCAQYAGTSAYLDEYAQIVTNKSLLRQMVRSAKEIEKRSLENPKDVLHLLDEAQHMFYKINQSAFQETGTHVKDIISGVATDHHTPLLQQIEARQEAFLENGGKEVPIEGIPTHLVDLDKLTHGLNPSQLTIIAGRPSMGKTAIAVNIAENVAFKSNKPVAIFSLEMTGEEILHRMIASGAEVESEKIRSGSLSGMEYQRIVTCVKDMQEKTLIIDDQPGLKITDLKARARRLKEMYDIQLLVIDYLQLLSGSRSVSIGENRQNEISEISRLLKTTARELNIPIICASQLSRKVEERAGHRPMLSDLRESGSIEQDADVVMLLFRRDYYNPKDKPGLAEVIVAKNRHGAVGNVTLSYRKNISQFNNYTPAPSEESDKAFGAFSP